MNLGKEKDIKPEDEGPIDPVKDPIKDIRQTPLNLVQGYEWCDCDVDDEKMVSFSLLYDLFQFFVFVFVFEHHSHTCFLCACIDATIII
jgi:hypothetical protein